MGHGRAFPFYTRSEESMNTSRLATSGLAGAIAGIAMLACGAANAATVERVMHQNASAFCQGALPAFAGTLRSRPLAVVNEGNAPAFVTCSFTTSPQFGIVNRLSVYFTNQNDSGSVQINCTGVFGVQRSAPVYLVKSVVVASGATANLAWEAADNGGADLPGPGNISCAMPPGAGVLDIFNYYNVEIGT